MTEINRHKGQCCWYLARDGKYKCAVTGCMKLWEKQIE